MSSFPIKELDKSCEISRDTLELLRSIQTEYCGVPKLVNENSQLTPRGIKAVKAIESNLNIKILK